MIILLSHKHLSNCDVVDTNIDKINQLTQTCTVQLAESIHEHYQHIITYNSLPVSISLTNRRVLQLERAMQRFIDNHIKQHGDCLRMVRWLDGFAEFTTSIQMCSQGNFYVDWYISRTPLLTTKYLIPPTHNIITQEVKLNEDCL
jgi:hypothetical protein